MQHTESPQKVHFSGIGGTAMVAGARLAIEAGCEVRGSDNPLYPPTSIMVEQLGVPIYSGYAAANLDWNPDIDLIGNALSRGNPEVEAALQRRMNYTSLPEWLKTSILRQRRPVAVCGTHGKTTTTALAAHVFTGCSLDPGYLIGGQPLGLPHSAHLGPQGAPFVIEGDEYDTAFFDKRAKFLHYRPEIAIVTSVEFDHGDIYRDLDEIDLAFQRMLRQIPNDGWLVACADNRAAQLLQHAFSNTATYGFDPKAAWRGETIPANEGFLGLRVYREGNAWAELEVPLAGRYNLQNTLAVVAAAALLGANANDIAAAVRTFPGVRRRMEIFLEARGAIFIDDFAHHPTAIRETVRAAHERWPNRRLRVLFEPRSNTTVTNLFQSDLEKAFDGADEIWFGPIHRANSIPEEKRLDRAALINALRKTGRNAQYCDDPKELAEKIAETGQPNDAILILSNGAFGNIYHHFKELYKE